MAHTPVPETINFAKEEENILKLWQKIDAFQTCLKQSKGKERFTFYDGPPFATGLPHYGHILAGTIKDTVTRFAHQSGFHVERRFGWDCHGLPVEFEIDKMLNIKGPDDVAKMGIPAYNAECRKIVMRYSKEWEMVITRLGRWIDFKNDYKTLYPSFMESVWWVFKQLYNKGLVYRGAKVMPYSTACNTPLSNFECGQNYKDVNDPAITVAFQLRDEAVELLAWTTTPWTLPSNFALVVNPDMQYVKVKENASNRVLVLLEKRLESVFKSPDDYSILDTFVGAKLKGKRYVPLFPYFPEMENKGAYTVFTDPYVTDDSGTGVVHSAPFFGEDDYRVCVENGVISRDDDLICPLDAKGCFVDPVTDFKGMYIKDADKLIMKHLKEAGKLYISSTIKHNYPFCWRSDTPLIYRIVPSWFIRVQHMNETLLECSRQSYWVPDFVKEKRFGNWLRDARDWAVSRNRYWGTPIPLWVSEDGKEVICIGSIAELESLTGQKVTDLHRESVDHLEIPSARPGCKPLRRIPEVFDCWFESGSMPYAQAHFPFENSKEFEKCFPANFIAEGIDQTRGWFYTLLVISTALFGKPPFKNLIVNGLVLASDGQKMSKRKKNYPDPLEVVNKYGADALRLYLINSPVVRAENLRFKEEGVKNILKDLFLPWYNAYRFLSQNIIRLEQEDNVTFQFDENICQPSENVMDCWILSFTQSLLIFVKKEMDAYRLYTVVPKLVAFIDNLTNWYVRMNRKRLKGDGGVDDCCRGLETLYRVLFSMVRIMAPFTPFLSELMYQNLRHLNRNDKAESVHYLMLPTPNPNLIDKKIESAISHMQTIIELGRVIRDRRTLPIKYPLSEVVVIHQDASFLAEVKELEHYILEELNVRKMILTSDKKKYGVALRGEPDHKTLGARLKGEFKAVTKEIKSLSDAQLQKFLADGKMELCGNLIEKDDIRIMFSFTGPAAQELSERYEAHSDNDVLLLLDITQNDEMLEEGFAREVINRVQKLRKKAQLMPLDPVTMYYKVSADGVVKNVLQSYREYIETAVKGPIRPISSKPANSVTIMEETSKIKDTDLSLVAVKGFASGYAGSDSPIVEQLQPACRYVKVQLSEDLQPRLGAQSWGVILLENPVQENALTFSGLCSQIEKLFGLHGICFEISVDGIVVSREVQVLTLNKKVLTVSLANKLPNSVPATPNFQFVNVEVAKKVYSVVFNDQVTPEQMKNIVNQHVKSVLNTDKFSLVGKLSNGETLKVKLG